MPKRLFIIILIAGFISLIAGLNPLVFAQPSDTIVVKVTVVDNQAPSTPLGLSAIAGDTTINLSWYNNTEPDLAGYNIYRASTTGGPYNKINTVLITANSYQDTGLTNNSVYYYVLTAQDTTGNESSYSSEVFATPAPSNEPPVAYAQNIEVKKDTAKTITLAATDANGDTLVYSIVTAPSHGALSGTALDIIYTPDTSYGGNDSFSFKANDGKADSNIAVVSIFVIDGLISHWKLDEASGNTALDSIGNNNGTITGAEWIAGKVGPGALYFDGNDRVTVPDSPDWAFGTGDFSLSFWICPLTDASGQSQYLLGQSYPDSGLGYDLRYSNNTISVVGVAGWGFNITSSAVVTKDIWHYVALTGTASICTLYIDGTEAGTYGRGNIADRDLSFNIGYSDGYSGQKYNGYFDEIEVWKGKALTSAQVQQIYLEESALTNNPPTAYDQSVVVAQNISAVITLTATDLDGNPLTCSIETAPANGALSGAYPDMTYTPNTGYVGIDSVTFKVNDGKADSNIATVSITVNDVPVANNDSYSVNQDTVLNYPAPGVLENDIDTNVLTAILVSGVSHGTLSFNSDGSFTYIPNTNYNGIDSFTYKANDGIFDSNIATVTITVAVVPISNNDNYTVIQDTTLYVFSPQQGVLANDIDARGSDIYVYTYNTSGMITSVIDPNSNKTVYTWDGLNRTAVTDANNNKITYSYDNKGNVASIQTWEWPFPVTTFTYDPAYNLVTSITDPLYHITNYVYDSKGNLVQLIDAAGNTTYYTYDNCGQLLNMTSANHQHTVTTNYSYDTYGNLSTAADSQNNITSFVYDILGNLESGTDAKNNTTSYTYDLNNNLTQITYPDNTTVSYAYDNSNNRISVTDQNDNITQYSYNEANLLTQVTDANNGVTTYAYDKQGNRTSVTDAKGNTTRYFYDNLNRLIQVQTPLGNLTDYSYDKVGNRLTTTDANNNTINYEYDKIYRLIRIIYPNNNTVEFTYDAASRKISMVDSKGTTTYNYNELNKLTEVNGSDSNDTISYVYDAAGNRIRMVNHDNGVTDYSYDNLNRLETLTDPWARLTTYSYDNVSNLTNILYPNNARTDYNFDNLNRLLTLTNKKTTEEIISSYSYKYNPAGMRTKATLANDDIINYAYNNLNQLTSEIKTNASATQIYYSYDYTVGTGFDPAGNRTSLNKNVDPSATNIQNPSFWDMPGTTNFSYNYNAENQLTRTIAQVGIETWITDYAYDNNGNTLTKTEYSQATPMQTEITAYTWGFENRLIQIVYPDGSSSEYEYDGAGKRIKTVEKDSFGSIIQTHKFLYDGLNVIIERDENDNTVAFYHRGLSYGGGIGGIISKTDSSGQSLYYHYDGIGNVTSLTDSLGNVVQTYTADAFGNPLTSTGSIENNYRFSTKESSSKSGLFFFGARYYEPRVGRWTQKDPLDMIDGPNMYLYANNSPVGCIDLWGFATYVANRKLGGNVRRARTNPITHTFTYTYKNGELHTYSWGNTRQDSSHYNWHKDNPEDLKAAREDIEKGGWQIGDDSLDSRIEQAYQDRATNPDHPSRNHQWRSWNNCKHEAYKLVKEAKDKKNYTTSPNK